MRTASESFRLGGSIPRLLLLSFLIVFNVTGCTASPRTFGRSTEAATGPGGNIDARPRYTRVYEQVVLVPAQEPPVRDWRPMLVTIVASWAAEEEGAGYPTDPTRLDFASEVRAGARLLAADDPRLRDVTVEGRVRPGGEAAALPVGTSRPYPAFPSEEAEPRFQCRVWWPQVEWRPPGGRGLASAKLLYEVVLCADGRSRIAPAWIHSQSVFDPVENHESLIVLIDPVEAKRRDER